MPLERASTDAPKSVAIRWRLHGDVKWLVVRKGVRGQGELGDVHWWTKDRSDAYCFASKAVAEDIVKKLRAKEFVDDEDVASISYEAMAVAPSLA